MGRTAASYLLFCWAMSLLGLWPRLWLWGLFGSLFRVFRVRDMLRAVAHRGETIPTSHGWLQSDPKPDGTLL